MTEKSLLIEAFIKSQKEFPTIKKDSSNPAFNSKYADLASIIDTVKPILTSHGLSYTQIPQTIKGDDGTFLISVETILFHESGEERSFGTMSFPVIVLGKGSAAQAFGTTLSYSKRYALLAILGLSTGNDDDDGNTSGVAEGQRPGEQYGRRQQQRPTQNYQQPYQQPSPEPAPAPAAPTWKPEYTVNQTLFKNRLKPMTVEERRHWIFELEKLRPGAFPDGNIGAVNLLALNDETCAMFIKAINDAALRVVNTPKFADVDPVTPVDDPFADDSAGALPRN